MAGRARAILAPFIPKEPTVSRPELPVFPFDSPPELDAEPEYARLRQEDPVPKVRLAPGGEAYLVTRHADVRRVLADPVFSRAATNKPGVPVLRPGRVAPALMLSMDAPDHTRVRKLMAHVFTMRAVERMRPRVQERVEALIDRMVAQGPPVEFIAAFASPLPALVVSDMVGIPADDHEQLRAWMDIALAITGRTPEEVAAAGKAMFGYLGGLIAHKRANPADDLLTGLIQARDDKDQLSEQELLFNTYLLMVGGYETTANLLANSLLTFARHPEQWELLRAQPERVPAAVEELLRYVRIAKATVERVATEDVELSGVRVPAGSTVIPLQYSANRDTAFLADADTLDVTRRPTQHLAFGHGIHFCIGAPLARLELDVAYTALLRRLPHLRPAIPEAEVEWKTGLLTRAPVALPVTW